MTLNTYLYFDGNCAAVFAFYKSVFGGEFAVCSKFADAPPDMKCDAADADKIMHVSLPIGESVLMGSDVAKGFGEAPKPGNNFALSYSPTTRTETERAFKALSAGGEATMPLNETFWGSYFGMCTDKFGIRWMVSCDAKA